jgi:ABC-2 type transport system ATP-binding protein
VTGVTVTGSDGVRITLEVTGEIAPVLKVIADHEPADLISRPTDLDELFLSFYREEASHAG